MHKSAAAERRKTVKNRQQDTSGGIGGKSFFLIFELKVYYCKTLDVTQSFCDIATFALSFNSARRK